MKTSKKLSFQKFDLNKKNADFHAEFKYENLAANSFSQKSYKQNKGKNQTFYAFTHTRLFSMVYNFFWWTFFAIF